jgi:hypothetical protein
MAIQDDLKSGILEFEQSAAEEEAKGRKRAAATLYFKAIVSACDYVIYLKLKKIPGSHAERFRVLESHFVLFYQAIDRVFPVYLQTYRSGISAEQMGMMKDALRKIKRLAESVEKGL